MVDNHATSNISYVAHLGDMTEDGNNNADESQWLVGDTAIRKLETNAGQPDGIPFGFTPGNHDLAGGGGLFEKWFGVSRFSGRAHYGGHYGADNRNSYNLFSASGLDFIAINVDCSATPGPAELDWADGLLKSNPARRALVPATTC